MISNKTLDVKYYELTQHVCEMFPKGIFNFKANLMLNFKYIIEYLSYDC